MPATLLERIRERSAKGLPGRGIVTADWYVKSAVDCVGPGVCKRYFGNGFEASAILKEAGSKLVYGAEIDEKGIATSVADINQLLDGIELPKHAMLAFPHILTSSREDRDWDVLETGGAVVDPKMPMLWQHVHTLPIGKMVKKLEHTDKVLKLASVLLDINDLTADAAKLIEANALRFSHGFRALEFVERKEGGQDTGGFRVTKFEIMEESLVSVPSNVDAEIELWSMGKLKSDVFKLHGKAMHDKARKPQGVGADFEAGKAVEVSSFEELSNLVKEGKVAVAKDTTSTSFETKEEEVVETACSCKSQPALAEVKDGEFRTDYQDDAPHYVSGKLLNAIGQALNARGFDMDALKAIAEKEGEAMMNCKRCKKPFVNEDLNDDGYCGPCAKALAQDGTEPPKSGEPNTKGGRVLSQTNYGTLKDAVDDLTELDEMCEKRAQKALCKACMSKVKSVMDQAAPVDPEDSEEKSAGESAAVTHESVMEYLLSAGPESLRHVAKAVDGLLKVHELDAVGKGYRALAK